MAKERGLKMKAAQIKKNNKEINVEINEIDRPNLQPYEVMIKSLYAAVNPLVPLLFGIIS